MILEPCLYSDFVIDRPYLRRRLHTGASVAALTILRDSALKRLPAELTALWVAMIDERKWRRDAGEALVRARLFQAPDLDAHLAKVFPPFPPLSTSSTPACPLTI